MNGSSATLSRREKKVPYKGCSGLWLLPRKRKLDESRIVPISRRQHQVCDDCVAAGGRRKGLSEWNSVELDKGGN
ncbi:hypothetical protein U1Q18_045405 [Sarracenia purpurea var. burkii]